MPSDQPRVPIPDAAAPPLQEVACAIICDCEHRNDQNSDERLSINVSNSPVSAPRNAPRTKYVSQHSAQTPN
jgi:hypothetical protein